MGKSYRRTSRIKRRMDEQDRFVLTVMMHFSDARIHDVTDYRCDVCADYRCGVCPGEGRIGDAVLECMHRHSQQDHGDWGVF